MNDNTLVKRIEKDNMRLSIYNDCDSNDDPRDWDNLGTMVCWHRRYNLGDKHDYSDYRNFLESLAYEFDNTDTAKSMLKEVVDNSFKDYKILYSVEHEGYVVQLPNGEDIMDDEVFETEEEAQSLLETEKNQTLDITYIEELEDEQLMKIIKENCIILPLYLYDHSGITISTGRFVCSWDSGQVGWIYATKDKLREETGYTESELFSKDNHRMPVVGELVKIKDKQDFGKITNIDNDSVTIDFDFKKAISHKKEENIITVNMSDIVEVNSNMAEKMLEAEVETYDTYLRGDIYGFVLEESKKCECCGHVEYEHKGSCWGFFGSDFKNNGILNHIPKTFALSI